MIQLPFDSILESYWGKAGNEKDPSWHKTILEHSLDVVAVSDAWVRLVPAIENTFFDGVAIQRGDTVASLRRFFFFLHDFGKITWKFQRFSPLLWMKLQDIPKSAVRYERDFRYDHGVDGFKMIAPLYELAPDGSGPSDSKIVLYDWLERIFGHHRILQFREKDGRIKSRFFRASFIDPKVREIVESNDLSARNEFLKIGAKLFCEGADKRNPFDAFDPKIFKIGKHNRNIQGFCSVCDWLASNEHFFEDLPEPMSCEEYLSSRTETAMKRLADFGVVGAKLHGTIDGMTTLFPDLVPRGIQTAKVDVSKSGALVIVEAPTGTGKTEYALSLASEMVAGGIADSVIFALPRQASANEMYRRVKSAVGRLFPEGASVSLAHGNASIYRPYLESRREIDDEDAETPETFSTEWLADSNKRALFGNVCVCTVDQILLSAFPLRHSFVRSFALSKSVLIVDEIHSYDEVSNTLLDYVLEQHAKTGGSAILLSATLPMKRRRKLVGMWEKAWDRKKTKSMPDEYPVVTGVFPETTDFIGIAKEYSQSRSVEVSLRRIPNAMPDSSVVEEIVLRAESGEVVAVVCNTVADCQKVWKMVLSQSGDVPVDIFHSRYMYEDREIVERNIVENYGPGRPYGVGRILVATQVVEQSLDLDFDFMVTQNCPIDLLFQRLGRLYRNESRRRVRTGFSQCLVLAHEGDFFGSHRYIYNDALLWRTRDLIEKNGNSPLEFPCVYRKWIDAEYNESFDGEPEDIAKRYMALESDGLALRSNTRLMMEEGQVLTNFSELSERTGNYIRFATRNGEFSLRILCYDVETERLIGKEYAPHISELDNPVFRERIERKRISAPTSWMRDEEFVTVAERRSPFGDILIPMKKTDDEKYELFPIRGKLILTYGHEGLQKSLGLTQKTA